MNIWQKSLPKVNNFSLPCSRPKCCSPFGLSVQAVKSAQNKYCALAWCNSQKGYWSWPPPTHIFFLLNISSGDTRFTFCQWVKPEQKLLYRSVSPPNAFTGNYPIIPASREQQHTSLQSVNESKPPLNSQNMNACCYIVSFQWTFYASLSDKMSECLFSFVEIIFQPCQ